MAVGDVSVSLGTSGVAAAISENPTYPSLAAGPVHSPGLSAYPAE